MSSAVLKEIFRGARQKHLQLRRLDTCFHAYCGALIEAFRERNYRLVGFDTTNQGALVVEFEQPDGDRFLVRVEPFRTAHTFLRAVGPVAEIVFTLNQHVDDPNVIASAQAGMMRQGVGRMLGVFSAHDNLNRGAGLSEPGNMRFHLNGAEVTATLNLVCNLNDYALAGLDYDKEKIGLMLDAVVYGLEKFVQGVLEKHSEL
ncbi:hypothetical protein JST97_20020 [bacterium]|nr:hypothetical protein [bacterium]